MRVRPNRAVLKTYRADRHRPTDERRPSDLLNIVAWSRSPMTPEGEAIVLVADDSPDNVLMVSLLLTKAGYRVLNASDGVEAFEAARRGRPLLEIGRASGRERVAGAEGG